MHSFRSATAWMRSRSSAFGPSFNPAARNAMPRSSPRRTNTASPWCSPACGISATSTMQLLIIGSGGREHALAWKCAASSRVRAVFVAPGNAGTAREAGVHNVDIAPDDIDGLLAFAQQQRIDLTIVGPEGPLVAGVVDRFTAAGLRCFGPTRAAARLEGSKAFTKDFLKRHG